MHKYSSRGSAAEGEPGSAAWKNNWKSFLSIFEHHVGHKVPNFCIVCYITRLYKSYFIKIFVPQKKFEIENGHHTNTNTTTTNNNNSESSMVWASPQAKSEEKYSYARELKKI